MIMVDAVNTCTDVRAVDALIEKADDHFKKVIKMMVDGVAFPDARDGSRYQVISHSGDDNLGCLTAADVSYAIHFVKSQGRQVGKMTSCLSASGLFTRDDDIQRPAYTFAWEDWYTYNGHRL